MTEDRMTIGTPDRGNEKLHFDILGHLFRHVSHLDTPSTPLERVLQICQAWREAALGHASLWTRLSIFSPGLNEARFWIRCIPNRIRYSGSHLPLDIEIESMYGNMEMANSILRALTGPEKEHVQRWRKFHVWASPCPWSEALFLDCLILPTPNLHSFHAHNVTSRDRQALPHAPLLKYFSVKNWDTPFPDLRNTTEIRISVDKYLDNAAICNAISVVTLSAESYSTYYSLSANFAALEQLKLEGLMEPATLVGFSAPRLRSLALKTIDLSPTDPSVRIETTFLHVYQCPGINLANLEKLTLNCLLYIDDTRCSQYVEDLKLILDASVSLRGLDVENRDIARIVLKVLENGDEFLDHRFRLRLGGWEMDLKQGEERLAAINEFRERAALPADASWDIIRDDLKRTKYIYRQVLDRGFR